MILQHPPSKISNNGSLVLNKDKLSQRTTPLAKFLKKKRISSNLKANKKTL